MAEQNTLADDNPIEPRWVIIGLVVAPAGFWASARMITHTFYMFPGIWEPIFSILTFVAMMVLAMASFAISAFFLITILAYLGYSINRNWAQEEGV